MNDSVLALAVAGIGAFLPGAPDWASLRSVLQGGPPLDRGAPAIPAAPALPAAERRRASGLARLAAAVAQQACQMAGYAGATLPCIFASTHGDLAITDAICTTLAASPGDLSPTRFHNSVLNAPVGYWTIATGCTAASSAVTAWHASFAAGLLEAAVFAHAEATPVLYACCDVASSGPLGDMTRTSLPFGSALVLAPGATGARPRLVLRTARTASPPPDTVPALRAVAADNPSNAQALALLAAIAQRHPTHLGLALSSQLSLDLELVP